jgi:hypothetical protein
MSSTGPMTRSELLAALEGREIKRGDAWFLVRDGAYKLPGARVRLSNYSKGGLERLFYEKSRPVGEGDASL